MACKLDLRRQVLEDLHSPFQDYTVSLIRDRAELNFNGVNNIDTIRLKIREINSQNAHDAVRLINMNGLKFLEFNPGPIADRYDSFSNFQDDIDLSNQALEAQENKETITIDNLDLEFTSSEIEDIKTCS